MKITNLKISGYKNLKNFNLTHDSDIISIIGNNGSGKSNLLEALCIIFYSLYNGTPLDFDFSIKYTNSKFQEIEITKKGSSKNFKFDGIKKPNIKTYLPKNIVAIYSGESSRLWKQCFEPEYKKFITDINKGQQYVEMPKMLYLNKFYWSISLLSLLMSKSSDNQNFIKEMLKINPKTCNIRFEFNKNDKYKTFNNSNTLTFIKSIDHKNEYTLAELKNLINDANNDMFKHLYIAHTSRKNKILENLTINFNGNITVDDLSEGEKKLLLMKAALEFAGNEDCLFILDEPDSHVHLNNKPKIIEMMEAYRGHRQIVLTTHSPTVTQALSNDNLYMLEEGKVVAKEQQQMVADLAGSSWNKQELNIFLSSNKPLILLVEGKQDKIHIQNAYNKLKSNYSDLNFDILHMNGAKNLAYIMKGLLKGGIENKKKIIAIFDHDKKGIEYCKDTESAYFMNKIKWDSKKRKIARSNNNKGFFSITLPNHSKHDGRDFTIENMYSEIHIKEAYNHVISTHDFKQRQSIDKFSKDIKKSVKKQLVEKSYGYIEEDFEHFNELFDIIKEIKEYTHKNTQKEEPINNAENTFLYNVGNFIAEGLYNVDDNSFTVLKGSQICKPQDFIIHHKEAFNKLDLKDCKNHYILQENFKFNSPTGAVKVIGNKKTINGLLVWKNSKGTSLKKMIRKLKSI